MAQADNPGIGSFVAHEKLRSAQEKMIKEGITALEENGFLFAAAPTGIGKTAASLAAALEVARSSSSSKQILFLTGRQSQHKIVVETIKKINSLDQANNLFISFVCPFHSYKPFWYNFLSSQK